MISTTPPETPRRKEDEVDNSLRSSADSPARKLLASNSRRLQLLDDMDANIGRMESANRQQLAGYAGRIDVISKQFVDSLVSETSKQIVEDYESVLLRLKWIGSSIAILNSEIVSRNDASRLSIRDLNALLDGGLDASELQRYRKGFDASVALAQSVGSLLVKIEQLSEESSRLEDSLESKLTNHEHREGLIRLEDLVESIIRENVAAVVHWLSNESWDKAGAYRLSVLYGAAGTWGRHLIVSVVNNELDNLVLPYFADGNHNTLRFRVA